MSRLTPESTAAMNWWSGLKESHQASIAHIVCDKSLEDIKLADIKKMYKQCPNKQLVTKEKE